EWWLRELADDRPDARGKVRPAHANRLGMRPGVEDDLRLRGQPDVHKHRLAVQWTERRHGAWFALREQSSQLVLLRKPNLSAPREVQQLPEVHGPRRRQDCLDRLAVHNTHDHFGPVPTWYVRRGRFLLRG